MAAQEEYSETMGDLEEHSETMGDQEEYSETMGDQEENNNNNNITYNTYVQIGARNKIQSTNEQTGNVEYDVAQLKVTVAAQGQKLENQATQLNALAEQIKAQAEELKVHDSIFKQQPANQHIYSQRIENNCSITLRVVHPLEYRRFGDKVRKLQVATGITVRELKVKIQQMVRNDRDEIGIISKNGGILYQDLIRGYDSTRTLTSLGVDDGDKVLYY